MHMKLQMSIFRLFPEFSRGRKRKEGHGGIKDTFTYFMILPRLPMFVPFAIKGETNSSQLEL